MDAREKVLELIAANSKNSARWFETNVGDLIFAAAYMGLVVMHQDTEDECYAIWVPGKMND